MKNLSTRIAAAAFASALALTAAAHAGVIVTENLNGYGSSWGEPTTWATYNANYSGNGLGVSSTNRVSQTFIPAAAEAGTVGKIFFRYANSSADADTYTLQVYKVNDVYANPLVVGDLVTQFNFSLSTTASTTSTDYPVLALTLTGSDQFTLEADQGYAFEVIGADTGSMTLYRRSGSSSNGQGYTNRTPIYSSPRDVLVAYTIVPEPATLALLGIGGLIMFHRRR